MGKPFWSMCANSSTSRALHSSWTEASRGDCISPEHVIIQRSEKCNTAVNRPVFLGQQGARHVSLLCRRRPAAAQRPARVLGRPTGASRQGWISTQREHRRYSTPSSSCLIFPSGPALVAGCRLSPARAPRRRACQYSPANGSSGAGSSILGGGCRCRASFQLPGGGMRHGVRLERRAVSDRIQEAIEERVEAVTGS
jgi:hypothetical protein